MYTPSGATCAAAEAASTGKRLILHAGKEAVKRSNSVGYLISTNNR